MEGGSAKGKRREGRRKGGEEKRREGMRKSGEEKRREGRRKSGEEKREGERRLVRSEEWKEVGKDKVNNLEVKKGDEKKVKKIETWDKKI